MSGSSLRLDGSRWNGNCTLKADPRGKYTDQYLVCSWCGNRPLARLQYFGTTRLSDFNQGHVTSREPVGNLCVMCSNEWIKLHFMSVTQLNIGCRWFMRLRRA